MVAVNRWLTIEQAAERVGKSKDTIYRWAREPGLGLQIFMGLVSEQALLDVDRRKRQRVGRPRAMKGRK